LSYYSLVILKSYWKCQISVSACFL